MSTTDLPFIQQQMVRYGMTFYLILGLIGNIFNCIIFTNRSYRRTPSSIYFLYLSIFAIIYLIWSTAPFLYTLNYTDPQTQSVFYCKVRLYGNLVLGQCLRYFVVFACADRFFVTQSSIRIRSLNSIPIAIKFVAIITVVCIVINIHLLIFMDIRDGVCETFGLYKSIYAIYQLTTVGILPPFFMSIFSVLTVYNLHQRNGFLRRLRSRDRYLLRMLMAEVIVNVSISIPYSVNLVYTAATFYNVNKSEQQLEIEAFITFVTQFVIYLGGVVPFYLFILTSKPFRRGFLRILVRFGKKCFVRRTRIMPSNTQNNMPIHNIRLINR